MVSKTRKETFLALFPDEPAFRWQQIERAFFDDSIAGWEGVTTLSKEMRKRIPESLPWMSLREDVVLKSHDGETEKALLVCEDGSRIETVLMRNTRGHWSVCVSSQVGCAFKCSFCATGTMGFTRNLSVDEIVDQFRFWQYVLARREKNIQKESGVSDSNLISNIVCMGMGEPLANYESVRDAIRTVLACTDMGPTRITVSTVGLMPGLSRLLEDPLWPPVRLAISLHSADAKVRSHIMPSSYGAFLDDLVVWTKQYFSLHDERRRHLTFEYIVLAGVNDRPEDIEKLIHFVRRVGKVKVNLIPYNVTTRSYRSITGEKVSNFLLRLKQSGVTATVRRSRGEDIAAACGQLFSEKRAESSDVR